VTKDLSQDPNGYSSPLQTKNAVPMNQWTQVTLTRKGKDLKLYLNGVLESTYTTAGIFDLKNDYNFRVGSRYPASGDPKVPYNPFLGEIKANFYYSVWEPTKEKNNE
jgi:hypothetical protein